MMIPMLYLTPALSAWGKRRSNWGRGPMWTKVGTAAATCPLNTIILLVRFPDFGTFYYNAFALGVRIRTVINVLNGTFH